MTVMSKEARERVYRDYEERSTCGFGGRDVVKEDQDRDCDKPSADTEETRKCAHQKR